MLNGQRAAPQQWEGENGRQFGNVFQSQHQVVTQQTLQPQLPSPSAGSTVFTGSVGTPSASPYVQQQQQQQQQQPLQPAVVEQQQQSAVVQQQQLQQPTVVQQQQQQPAVVQQQPVPQSVIPQFSQQPNGQVQQHPLLQQQQQQLPLQSEGFLSNSNQPQPQLQPQPQPVGRFADILINLTPQDQHLNGVISACTSFFQQQWEQLHNHKRDCHKEMSTRISIIDEREVQIKSQMDLLQTELSDLKREKQLLTATLGSYTADLGSIDSDKKHLSNLVSEMSGLMTRVKSQSQSNERSKGPSTWQSRDEREKRDWDRDDPSFQSSNVRERKYEDYSRRDDNTFSTSRDLPPRKRYSDAYTNSGGGSSNGGRQTHGDNDQWDRRGESEQDYSRGGRDGGGGYLSRNNSARRDEEQDRPRGPREMRRQNEKQTRRDNWSHRDSDVSIERSRDRSSHRNRYYDSASETDGASDGSAPRISASQRTPRRGPTRR